MRRIDEQYLERPSNSLDSEFCVQALEEALGGGRKPEIFNTDQGLQFTIREPNVERG